MNYYSIRETARESRGSEGRESLAMRYSRALAAYSADTRSPAGRGAVLKGSVQRSVPETPTVPHQVPVRELARTYQQEPFVPGQVPRNADESQFMGVSRFAGHSPRGTKSAFSACRLCGRYVVLWTFVVASLISLGMLILEGVHRDDFPLQIVNRAEWDLGRHESIRASDDVSGENSSSGYAFVLN